MEVPPCSCSVLADYVAPSPFMYSTRTLLCSSVNFEPCWRPRPAPQPQLWREERRSWRPRRVSEKALPLHLSGNLRCAKCVVGSMLLRQAASVACKNRELASPIRIFDFPHSPLLDLGIWGLLRSLFWKDSPLSHAQQPRAPRSRGGGGPPCGGRPGVSGSRPVRNIVKSGS
jgi:hypothetical protein